MLKPIARGDRGAAVEDIQKRLLMLGYDLGPTGVDGVFLGATLAAVRSFQQTRGLAEDGTVGDETWAALVDSTFRLGDRLLYLRLPYLHGADVRVLQGALNVLGFACGQPDGIFGTYTERAVGEFQANVNLPADGIAGPETIRAIERLQHVWRDKDPAAPAALAVAPARAAEVLRGALITLIVDDECARDVASRVANLALATEPDARVSVLAVAPDSLQGLVLRVTHDASGVARPGVRVIAVSGQAPCEGRFVAAFAGASSGEPAVLLSASACTDEHEAQSVAVRILDGLCAVLSRESGLVVP